MFLCQQINSSIRVVASRMRARACSLMKSLWYRSSLGRTMEGTVSVDSTGAQRVL